MNTTLHFVFSDAFKALMTAFLQDHFQDDRKAYKTAWIVLRQQHDIVFAQEAERLKTAGYKGDTEEKFFHAGRYYFRKKLLLQIRSCSTCAPASVIAPVPAIAPAIASAPAPALAIAPAIAPYKRFTSSTITKAIDLHIRDVGLHSSSPAEAYALFHRMHEALVFAECHHRTEECLWDKLKKTYKNRYHKVKRDMCQHWNIP